MGKYNKAENHRKEIRKKPVLPPGNPTDSLKNKDDKLVTVEIQKEFDVLDKAWENKVFVKLFVAARTSGLLKKISDCEFKTLITLALYMDENGDCYPSQYQIARDLGCTRLTATRRIQSLLNFRFNGNPIVKAVKKRGRHGEWNNNYYTILPVSQIKIFEKPPKDEVEDNHVSKVIHGPCNETDTSSMYHNHHTNNILTLKNKNQLNNVKENAVFNKGKKKKRSPEKESLASYIAEQLEDDHSLGFYRRIVDNISENLIYQALSEVKDTYLTGKIIKSKAALFNTIIQNKAKENNINLGINKTVN
jgi:biotin operon repressor